MKKIFTSISICILLCLCFITPAVFAQTGSISGKVIDEKSQPVSYATVQLKGTMLGANTDEEGMYEIAQVPAGSYTLVISYVGYAEYNESVTVAAGSVAVNVQLKTDYLNLNEVVVVGYGTKQVKDLTGTVTSVSQDEFNQGAISSPEQLLTGKVAGLQVTTDGGGPGSGSTIRIRGGTSINASNDPLIVIDGVPIDNSKNVDGTPSIAGSGNALNLFNPNDIENITILKDASAAAIYGSRAANGVIIITTKKGLEADKLNIGYSSKVFLSSIPGYASVLTADEVRDLINSTGNDDQKALLGTETTDWQKEIYRTPLSSDNNITFSGGIKDLPYRFTAGYLNENGILARSKVERTSLGLNLSPLLLKDHLKIDVNAKLAYTNNFFTDLGAVGSAVTFDPTQPVYSGNSDFGGYFEWLDPTTGVPNTLAPKNPVGLIYQKDDISDVYRFLGNIQLDYRLHFFEDLRANLNLGTDLSRSNGTVFIPAYAASKYTDGGQMTQYKQEKDNKLLEFYLNYLKDIEGINSRVDLTAGYSYQDWITSSPAFAALNATGDTITPAGIPTKKQNTLISFYGRLNYTFKERYLLTATLRDDGSSRFSPDTRWGLFPSLALAWRISDEGFLKNSSAISNLKLRLGFGITGQQDVLNDYPYIPNYSQGEPTAQYQFGNAFYYVLRPDGYDANIKWEETKAYGAGLDFGFVNGRISGSIDVYKKMTYDLLAVIPVPAGTNFTNNLLTNVGDLENQGFELTLNTVPLDQNETYLEIGGNFTYNQTEITKLTKVQDTTSKGIQVGGISGVGIGNTVQIHSVGYPPFTFWLNQQQYDEDGNPIEGEYLDVNGDSLINVDDNLWLEKPAPDVYFGFYASLRHGNWNFGFSLRGSIGNYVYNNVNSSIGQYTNIDGSKGYLNNLSTDYYNTLFQTPQIFSDYYLEDASFLRCDNISVGYNFRNIAGDKVSLRLTGVVQNVFVISGYSGLDPEVASGIDNNFYPRPRIFSIMLDLNF